MGKGKKKDQITGGIYEGDTGVYQADEDPLGFYKFALANEGRTGFNTAPDAWNYLTNQGFQNIFDSYQGAQGADKNLQFVNYMANRYGASPTMTPQNPYYTAPPTVVDQEFGNPDGRKRGKRRRPRQARSPYAGNSALGG